MTVGSVVDEMAMPQKGAGGRRTGRPRASVEPWAVTQGKEGHSGPG